MVDRVVNFIQIILLRYFSLSCLAIAEMQLRRSMTDWRRPWSAIKCVLYPLSPCLVSVRLSGRLVGWWWLVVIHNALWWSVKSNWLRICILQENHLAPEWMTDVDHPQDTIAVCRMDRRWWCDLMDRRLTMTDIVCAFSSAPRVSFPRRFDTLWYPPTTTITDQSLFAAIPIYLMPAIRLILCCISI